EFELPRGKNLFVDLVERISKELNVTICWACGNTQMTDIWPWEGISLGPLELLRWKQKLLSMGIRKQEQWNLKEKIIGEECILRRGGEFNTPVGNMACKRYQVIKNAATRWVPKDPLKYWTIGKKPQGCI
ncbi:ENR1 protein, partial [Certhia familiaris]|nr:ENR1 protein [Certhia familiaris]